MRCILVGGANLKADTRCTYCHQKIGDSYAREIGTRYIYCDYNCYQSAKEASVLACNLPANTWTVNS